MAFSDDDKPTRDRDQRKHTRPDEAPLAGPHARPELTDSDKTPGSGMFPSETEAGDGHAPSG